jgi:hypothetical protein
MKASVSFGVGSENGSVDVLWRDAGRAFCRLCRHNAEGDKHAYQSSSPERSHTWRQSRREE